MDSSTCEPTHAHNLIRTRPSFSHDPQRPNSFDIDTLPKRTLCHLEVCSRDHAPPYPPPIAATSIIVLSWTHTSGKERAKGGPGAHSPPIPALCDVAKGLGMITTICINSRRRKRYGSAGFTFEMPDVRTLSAICLSDAFCCTPPGSRAGRHATTDMRQPQTSPHAGCAWAVGKQGSGRAIDPHKPDP